MRYRCPSCQGLFELDRLPASGKTHCPTCNQPVKVGSAPAIPIPSRPVPRDPDFSGIPNVQFQPQTLPAYLTQPPPPRTRRVKNPWDEVPTIDQRRKSSGSKVIFWVLGSWLVGMLVLVLAAAIGFVVYSSGTLLGKTTIALDGFSISAPGRPGPENKQGGIIEKTALSRRTGSQFAMMHVPSMPGKAIDAVAFVNALDARSRRLRRGSVERLGMRGISFEAEQGFDGASAEGEIFDLSDGILVVLYIPGSEIASVKGKQAKYTGDKERQLDAPETFFASLKRD